MDDKASYVLALIDRITAPARKMGGAVKRMREAFGSTKSAADSASNAIDKMGAATEKAGARSLKGAAAMKRAAGQMRAATMSASYASLKGRGAGQLAAAGQLGMIGKRNTGNLHAFGGGRLMTRLNARAPGQFGPKYDPSAQGAAAGGMGPVLNRGAQKLGIIDRLDVGTKKLRDWNWQMGTTIEKWSALKDKFMGTPFGIAAKGLMSVAGGIASIALEAGLMVVQLSLAATAIFSLAAAYTAFKAIEKAAFSESAKKSLSALTGSAMAGAAAYKQARAVAKELGADAQHTIQQFIELRAAQFTMGEAETLIKLSADLQTVTGEAEAASRAIRAITQIKAKGKVQTEELLQLSEAGLSLDLVFGELAKSMNMSRPQLQKALQAGKIDAVKGVAAIQSAIMHKLHETKAGDVAKAAATTMSGLITQLKNLPSNLMLDIGEIIDVSGARGIVQDLLDAAGRLDKKAIAGMLEGVIKNVRELVRAATSFGEGFLGNLGVISDALGATLNAGDWKQYGARAADVIAVVIRGVKLLVNVLAKVSEWLANTDESVEALDGWDLSAKMVGAIPVVGTLLELFVKLTGQVARFIGLRDEALGIKKKIPPPPPPPIPHLFPYADPAIQATELSKRIKTPALGSAYPNSRPQYQLSGVPTPRPEIWGGAQAGSGSPSKTNITFGSMSVQVPPNTPATPQAFGKAVRAEVAAALAEFADRNMSNLAPQ